MASAALGGVSAVGNAVGGKAEANAQNNATNQAGQEFQQTQQLINNYIGSVSPTVANLVGGLLNGTNPISQAISSAIGQITNTSGSATQLASTAANYGNSPTNTQLANWNGLKPEELNALTTNAANSGASAIKTAQSQGGYGANQNAVMGSALNQNELNAESAAVNIGSNASQQEVGALESANTAGLGGIESGLSGLGTAITGYGTAAGAGNTQLGTTNQGIVGGSSLLNPTVSGGSLLTSMGGANLNSAAQGGNPYAPLTSSLGQLSANNTFGSGGKGGSSASNPLGSYTGGLAGGGMTMQPTPQVQNP